MNGKVKSFNYTRGYGFIDLDGQDVFFHYSSLNMDGYKKIKVNTLVSFELLETENGLKATNINIIK